MESPLIALRDRKKNFPYSKEIYHAYTKKLSQFFTSGVERNQNNDTIMDTFFVTLINQNKV